MNISQWKNGNRTFFSLEVDDRLLLLCTSPVPALVTTSTLCDVSVICVGNVGINIICRNVLSISDMKARVTNRVVPPYTSYKLLHRCKDDLFTSPLHSGLAAALVWTLGPRMFCGRAGAPLLLHRLAEDRSWAPGLS